MTSAWRIELTDEARKQLNKISATEAGRILRYLRQGVESLDDPVNWLRASRGSLPNYGATVWMITA